MLLDIVGGCLMLLEVVRYGWILFGVVGGGLFCVFLRIFQDYSAENLNIQTIFVI